MSKESAMVMRRLALLLAALSGVIQGGAAQQTIVLHASTVLDGRGATLGMVGRTELVYTGG